jgi:hypothetical protein
MYGSREPSGNIPERLREVYVEEKVVGQMRR